MTGLLAHRGLLLGASAPPTPSGVHSQFLYTGDGAFPRALSGVDMSSGGWTFLKATSVTQNGSIYYSVNGSSPQRKTSSSNATVAAAALTFDSGGTTLTTGNPDNISARPYVGHYFRKAASFCDVLTYTGTGSATTIPHSLGIAPGLIIVKKALVSQDGRMYHASLGANVAKPIFVAGSNLTGATYWNNTAPTSAVFSVGTDVGTNDAGVSYFAILMADDSSPSGQIRTFSYTGNGSVSGPTVALGWEPYYVCLFSSNSGNSPVVDSAIGFATGWMNLTQNFAINPATSITASGTGFQVVTTDSSWNQNAVTYFGFAIRKP